MEVSELKNRNDVAKYLGINLKTLTYVLYAEHVEKFYKTFTIPKKNGDERVINAPNGVLKIILKKLSKKLSYLYYLNYTKNQKDDISQAFLKKKSFITNAEIHVNKKYIINIDLKNFFNCFHFGRVKGFFEKNNIFKLPNEVAVILAQLTCYNGVLPQGAPTSPIITNFICRIFDYKIVKIAKKYKLKYSRYADDLTFSTNDPYIKNNYGDFLEELNQQIISSGFEINKRKTSFQFNSSRQMVTGLVVNRKINCKREYYKNTKSMANSYYHKGTFTIDGEKGTLNQLEGRFSFIYQIDKKNNEKIKKNKNSGSENSNSRENEYKKFLFFKYFYNNDKPLIITEGKTDILYLKAALMNLHERYPELIKKEDNRFYFKIKFLKKNKSLFRIFKISVDGADANNKIIQLMYNDSKNSLYNRFRKICKFNPKNAVVIIFDNEGDKEKPLMKFLNCLSSSEKDIVKTSIENELNALVKKEANLFILVNPKKDEQKNTQIEELFDDKTLNTIINGKKFSLDNDYSETTHYGKQIFSKYIFKNYEKINFINFIPMLDSLNNIIKSYKKNE